MDFDPIRTAARSALDPLSWDYYEGVADGRPESQTDHEAWQRIGIVPRVMQGLTEVDTTLTIAGATFSTPVLVAPTAAHGLAHPDGEVATLNGAAAAGALMIYSSSARVEVTEFGAAADGPWWAQVYLMRDRLVSDDYIARAVAAGARALVLTVDLSGGLAEAPFRQNTRVGLPALPGNFPGLTWAQMSAGIDANLRPDHVSGLIESTGLPVWVKGVLHPEDAVAAVEAGAAGVIVSNHGRRQVAGVVPTAEALGDVVDAVGGRVPVVVDGGIRSGVDLLRALALGASAVGVGRPVLWGLATTGTDGVRDVLAGLTVELRQAMAATGAGSLSAINRTMVRPATFLTR
ncbi:4-hydroxymandelate oxidase [Nakamurella sp. UYEF19]|uniref:alpha-hydroxy acid oxidase n=1 Tax=Nakamurella sp. UYEF19 TaxID=1756392 RepID=UPI003393CAE2